MNLPIIDLSGDPSAVSKSLGKACREFGFVTLSGHGIDLQLLQSVSRCSQEFFALPLEKKMLLAKRSFRAENTNQYRGYFPAEADIHSYKEGFEIGPEETEPVDQEFAFLSEKNVWGAEKSEFRQVLESYHRAMSELTLRVLSFFELDLGTPRGFLTDRFSKPSSTLRVINYPRTEHLELITPEHQDTGIVTLLYQADESGLEVEHLGKWLPVPVEPEMLVMNLGQLLERWSGHAYRATPHRVKNSFRERMSIPFFAEPNYSAKIQPLGGAESFIYQDLLLKSLRQFDEYRDLF